jgi:hypothetical protein
LFGNADRTREQKAKDIELEEKQTKLKTTQRVEEEAGETYQENRSERAVKRTYADQDRNLQQQRDEVEHRTKLETAAREAERQQRKNAWKDKNEEESAALDLGLKRSDTALQIKKKANEYLDLKFKKLQIPIKNAEEEAKLKLAMADAMREEHWGGLKWHLKQLGMGYDKARAVAKELKDDALKTTKQVVKIGGEALKYAWLFI